MSHSDEPSAVGAKVLIIDDDLLVLENVAALLDRHGYRVWAADSGEAALRLCAELQPDVVVTDLRMPGMDGLTLLERLAGAGTRAPRMILYSATLPASGEAGRLGRGWVWVSKAAGHEALLAALGEGRSDG